MTRSPRTLCKANPIDAHVGTRLRSRRILMRWSEARLAEYLGVSPERVLAYETGTRRIPAERLFEIATLLNVAVWYFYDGLEQHRAPHATPSTTPLERNHPPARPVILTVVAPGSTTVPASAKKRS